ncbi:MAG: DUF262 domain-containing protein [Bacteroidales bacterium]|jgi:hypothetical protein|nr:DUF262 domain-containing protein [Bacteroidales bacterium]
MEENTNYIEMQSENQNQETLNDIVEIEQIETSVSLMEKPFDPTKINIETKTPSLDTLIRRIKNKTVQLNTESYFQRKDDLWDIVKQSRLIESILIQFPLPAFFFDATDDENWLVVDGLQRLSSIRNFCVERDDKKRLKLTNLEFLTQLNGKTWDDLPGNLQTRIEESQVVIYKIMPGTPTDVKFNIFKRINTGGLILEPQEIRHALFQGKPAVFIAELAKIPEFLQATGNKIPTHRMLDRDFANRFLCFYLLGYENYQSDLDTYMSKAMAGINNKSDEEIQKIVDDFRSAMDLSWKIFGKEAFRKVYHEYDKLPPVNKALFDAIATQFALLSGDERQKLEREGMIFKDLLKNRLNEDPAFFTSITSSTGDRNRVAKRHETIKELIQQTLRI